MKVAQSVVSVEQFLFLLWNWAHHGVYYVDYVRLCKMPCVEKVYLTVVDLPAQSGEQLYAQVHLTRDACTGMLLQAPKFENHDAATVWYSSMYMCAIQPQKRPILFIKRPL